MLQVDATNVHYTIKSIKNVLFANGPIVFFRLSLKQGEIKQKMTFALFCIQKSTNSTLYIEGMKAILLLV